MLKFYHCLCLLIVLTGCAMPNKVYSLSESDVVVKGDKIYYKDKLFAELRFLKTSDAQCHQGLSIYYYQYSKEVWIYPTEGWHILMVEENKKYSTVPEIEEQLIKADKGGYLFNRKKILFTRGDRDFREFKLKPVACDIRISEDGKYVYYKTLGIFFGSYHKYLVEYGISK